MLTDVLLFGTASSVPLGEEHARASELLKYRIKEGGMLAVR